MKIVLYDDNEKIVAEKPVPKGTTIHDIFNRSEFIATKLWSEEDVRSQLEANGFEPSDDNIAAVINTGYLKRLDDCTDADWMIIDYAIWAANDSNTLK
jgi:hypothetical protein